MSPYNFIHQRIIICILIGLFYCSTLTGQDLYKTPSGERYHKASCHMVENVSAKLVDENAIFAAGLTPCKICEPPKINAIQYGISSEDKSVGQGDSVQCKGLTQKGQRCLHKTRLGNGYCYQHTAQNSSTYVPTTPSSHLCGARTKSGGSCQRSVREGLHCYQHGG